MLKSLKQLVIETSQNFNTKTWNLKNLAIVLRFFKDKNNPNILQFYKLDFLKK